MTLYYQTEYCLGRRGGRVCHTYHGFQALIAILVALALGFAFGVLGFAFGVLGLALLVVRFALRSVWAVLVAVMTLVVAVLSSPFRAGRWVARQVETRQPALKPAWVPLDDLA
jgi:hypothetical protein